MLLDTINSKAYENAFVMVKARLEVDPANITLCQSAARIEASLQKALHSLRDARRERDHWLVQEKSLLADHKVRRLSP